MVRLSAQPLWRALLASLVAAVFFTVQVTKASEEEGFDSPYLPSADVMAEVDATLAKARDTGKLALIVMGATWCHDSRGLAKRFRSADVGDVIDDKYEVLYVDVGYLSDARAVNQRFGMPSIYATPTVMIIDPETEMLTNSRTMHMWRNADSISYPDTRAYFAKEAETARSPAPAPEAALQAYFDSIDAFEAQEAARLVAGYDLIGPQLAMEPDYPDGFEDLWREVRNFRYKLTDDLLALRAQAEQLAAEGISEPLAFPSYPALSWESE
ncbi:MAG: thioredoxin family protein [Kordiimonadaceae bacterium]|nr:thioredoxin family protein [Kordiimonadaceae bacterium]MBO6569556.1 thioredoxin family protein [Kordiimonadaceae bacterium]MBO6965031.1 thioredoxin family protein [Kordiimonadaceae bacterium]